MREKYITYDRTLFLDTLRRGPEGCPAVCSVRNLRTNEYRSIDRDIITENNGCLAAPAKIVAGYVIRLVH